jgi:SRSO17 transposase
MSLPWPGQEATPRFVVAAVPGSAVEIREGTTLLRPRLVLAEWPPELSRPRAQWLTNLGPSGMAEMTGLLRARQQVTDDVDRLVEDIGIRHFEGRSYQGWHHHVTLASIAHAYRFIRHQDEHRMVAELLCPEI